jgi:chromosome segregation ATPase
MATLSEKQAELTAAKAALAAAEKVAAYTQGDRQQTRQGLRDLETRVARIAREVDELTAAAAGANNPMMITPTWT